MLRKVTKTRSAVSFFLMGLHLGVLQVGAYFIIQCFVTATFLVYFAILLAWMGGAIFSLKCGFPRKLSSSLILSIGAYYFLLVLTERCIPGPVVYLSVFLLFFLIALPAGTFFRVWSSSARAHSLFFHENNGFVAGYVISLIFFVKGGIRFLYVAPILSCAFASFRKGSSRSAGTGYWR